jgi:hypothetical protein
MRLIGIVVLAALMASSCAQKPVFELYRDPGGDYSLEVPKGWPRAGNADLKRKPNSVISFIGRNEPSDEGTPLGAVLYVTKFYRQRSDFPGDAKGFDAYRQEVLAPSEALFGAGPLPAGAPRVSDMRLGGLAAKTYRRDYEHFNRLHMPKPVAMRLEDVVIQTREAFYVLEYRATSELFDRYHYAFEKAKASFQLANRNGP